MGELHLRVRAQSVLNHPAPVLVVMLLTVGVSGYLYVKIPKGFFPQQDTGRLQGQINGQQHISYQSLVEKTKWFEEQVASQTDPRYRYRWRMSRPEATAAAGAARSSVCDDSFVSRKSAIGTPTRGSTCIRQQRLFRDAGRDTFFLASRSRIFALGGRQGNAQYQYTPQGRRISLLLAKWGLLVSGQAFLRLPEIVDVSFDQQNL